MLFFAIATHAAATISFRSRMPNELTTIDLFSGAGGLSLGFSNAGFTILLAADIDKAAVATHQRNLGGDAKILDLGESINAPVASVVVGGPPCQGFSSAGLRKAGDHRNSLVSRFARFIASSLPQAFVFENVEGFLTAENGERVIELLEPLVRAGYRIHVRKINAANYGVPQHRKRVLAIGGLGWDPTFPEPTHTAFGAPGALRAAQHLPLTPTVGAALAGLPPAATAQPGRVQGHVARMLSGADLERAKSLQQGQTMRDLPAEFHHDSYRRRAFRRVMDGTPTDRRGGAPAGIRRLRADQPSKAITGSSTSEFLHPTEDRPLTARECARLQTFPDDFEFCGTASEQSQLIGNAVPPLLAHSIAISLAQDLMRPRDSDSPGALLSFVPTLAEGMSPALRRVVLRVEEKFGTTLPDAELSLWL